jgi:superfamily II DNA or RNA helicase
MSKNIKHKMFTSTWRRSKVPQVVSPNGIITLRKWQSEAQEAKLSTNKQHFIVNAPTGGGKSKFICSVSLNRLKLNPKLKVIICVPQKSIGGGFVGEKGGDRYIVKGKEEKWLVEALNNFCTGEEEQKTKGLVDFLTDSPLKSARDRVVICTHATFAQAFGKIQGIELSDIDLWIDEAHHISISDFEVNKLGQAVNYFFENNDRNLSVNMATATLFRADKNTVVPKEYESECESFKLPYDKHFEENCRYLKSFSYDFMLDQKGYDESIKKLFKDEVKKTIVFVPHPNTRVSSGNKLEEVQKILEAISGRKNCKYTEDENGCYLLNKNGKQICVVDLVDDRDTKLRDRRDQFVRDFPEKIDVILNINKFTEGADWPHANRAIIVGQKGSLVQMIQIIGRLFRDHVSKEDKPVEVIQLFSWVDKHSFDEDSVKENINNYVKAIYASLILESIIDPPDIKVKDTRKKKDGKKKGKDTSLKDILTDELTESEYHNLIENGIDELIKFGDEKPFNEQEYLKFAQEFVEEQLVDNENLLDFSEDISKFILEICKKRNRQVMLQNYPNVSEVDFEAVEKMNPASFLCAYTNNICGINTLRDFRDAFASQYELAKDKKEKLLEMARMGEDRPSWNTHILGKVLTNYTITASGTYDPEFDKNIRKIRPDWFVPQSELAKGKKRKLLEMAKNREDKPKKRENKLGSALISYTSQSSETYDQVFDKEIRELRPDWFIKSHVKKKRKLLEMAKNGEEKPSPKFSLGRCLHSYTNVNNSCYDSNFYEKIKSIRQDWFTPQSDSSSKNKKALLEMAKNGEVRPNQKKHKLGPVLSSYTQRGRETYDEDFDNEIRELRPDWFLTKSNLAHLKKKEILIIASNGGIKPKQGHHKYGAFFSRCTNKNHISYDKDFDKEIRTLRPDWFKK